MIETYEFRDEPPLDVEILALGGIDDGAVSPAQLDAWRNHTSRAFSARRVPGGHFFLFHNGDNGGNLGNPAEPTVNSAALRIIIDRMLQLLAADTSSIR
jgi:hypothetical protein